MEMLQLIGAIVTLIGSLFLFLGALGILRMPDLYNRIQAGTKATTLGAGLTLVGVGIVHVAWLPKIIILILFVFITNPVSSHVLARAAHFLGKSKTDKTVVDKLEEKRGGE